MSLPRLVRFADLVRTPWKNGGGTTAEIAVAPTGAGFDSFDWRFSMAEVASDGPFSPFPGVDRTLVLIDGAGFVLTVEGRHHRLDPDEPQLSFAGDAPASGQLVAGPVRDFNVMTRRGRATHQVVLASAGERVVDDTSLILAHIAPLEIAGVDGDRTRLDRFDALLSVGPARLILSGPAVVAQVSTSRSR